MWDLSVNAHWLFPVTDRIAVYPLAGLAVLHSGTDLGLKEYGIDDVSETELAYNIGGGIDFKLTDKLIFNVELKYKGSDMWDRLLLSAGLAYKF